MQLLCIVQPVHAAPPPQHLSSCTVFLKHLWSTQAFFSLPGQIINYLFDFKSLRVKSLKELVHHQDGPGQSQLTPLTQSELLELFLIILLKSLLLILTAAPGPGVTVTLGP